MTQRLGGKVAIVTGAGRGTGAAIAQALAAAGARVVANDINPDRAESIAETIRGAGGMALAIDADVSNKFHCVKLVEATRSHWGRLDVLVNNAHVSPAATILKMDEWDWDRCLDVNLKGTFLMSQLVGRVMADENRESGGSIVNVVAHAGGQTGWELRAAFEASQAGVAGFGRACAREYAPYGIRVNTVVRSHGAADCQGTVGAVLFLCSEEGGVISGATIQVDAGLAPR
jgi:3-oxoacyl-[acyl-carrier protein] reductase